MISRMITITRQNYRWSNMLKNVKVYLLRFQYQFYASYTNNVSVLQYMTMFTSSFQADEFTI